MEQWRTRSGTGRNAVSKAKPIRHELGKYARDTVKFNSLQRKKIWPNGSYTFMHSRAVPTPPYFSSVPFCLPRFRPMKAEAWQICGDWRTLAHSSVSPGQAEGRGWMDVPDHRTKAVIRAQPLSS